MNALKDEVRRHYADAARDAGCCTGSCGTVPAGYGEADAAAAPGAAACSLGSGNPIAAAELREGETVLDLGSGGGFDVILAARRVGPTGYAYGVDMTEEMLELGRRNAAEAGVTNVEFLRGEIEALPLAGETVDVVVSNCVLNLSTDKAAVFRELARVLRPSGRVAVSDIVAEDTLDEDARRERGSYVGCIAGALSISEYVAGLESAGLVDVSVEPAREVADGMHSAIVRARKP